MKLNVKILFISMLFLTVLTVIKPYTHAETQNVLTIHLFHSNTCPHCAAEREFLKKLLPQYPNVKLEEYEISDKTNVKLMIETSKRLKTSVSGVPFLVIGNQFIVGYQTDDTTGIEIENQIKQALISKPNDIVNEASTYLKTRNQSASKAQTTSDKTKPGETIKVPFIGNMNVNSVSLPVLTVVIGLLDGFNPCAMWVLLFLISLLIGMNDKKRMWILGGAFLFVSGAIYYLFMAAWLNVFLIVGYASIVRYIIGISAGAIGIYYLRRYFKDKDGGCETADVDKKKQIFDKVKNITNTKSLVLALIGIVSLAVAVNMFELLCSAGLPAIYTKVLTMTPMPRVSYYLYLLGYIFFYMVDDLIVFVVAMITFQTMGIESKYTRYAQLIGGIIMIIIGILMIANPSLLTSGLK